MGRSRFTNGLNDYAVADPHGPQLRHYRAKYSKPKWVLNSLG